MDQAKFTKAMHIIHYINKKSVSSENNYLVSHTYLHVETCSMCCCGLLCLQGNLRSYMYVAAEEARIWGTFTYNLNFIIVLKTHDFIHYCRVLPSPSIPTPTQADMQVVIHQVQRNCDGKALDEEQVPCCAVLIKWKSHSWLPTCEYTQQAIAYCNRVCNKLQSVCGMM